MHSNILSLRYESNNLDDKLLTHISVFLKQHFDLEGGVDADGLYIISALCQIYGNHYKSYCDNFWPYIYHGLNNVFFISKLEK